MSYNYHDFILDGLSVNGVFVADLDNIVVFEFVEINVSVGGIKNDFVLNA